MYVVMQGVGCSTPPPRAAVTMLSSATKRVTELEERLTSRGTPSRSLQLVTDCVDPQKDIRAVIEMSRVSCRAWLFS